MKPIVCYVTDSQSLEPAEPRSEMLAKIEAAVDAGLDWVQIREKELPARELLRVARAAIAITAGKVATSAGTDRPGPLVFVNDRLDVASAAGAAGVHLGRESLPERAVFGWRQGQRAAKYFMVGISCHSINELRQAENAEADYVFFGPVFDTPAKRSYGPPQGIAKLAAACASTRLRVIAIGGVTQENSTECLRAGAAGIAAIRMFQQARHRVELRDFVERVHGFC